MTQSPPEWFQKAVADRGEQLTLQLDGQQIVVSRWGSPTNPLLILVHGSGASARWFDHTAPYLATDHQVVALDLSGHGYSAWRSNYSWEGWADEVAAVAAHFTVETSKSPLILGHSLGGAVALKATERHPRLFAGIIMVDTNVLGSRAVPQNHRLLDRQGLVQQRQKYFKSQAEALARYRFLPSSGKEPAEYIRNYLANHALLRMPQGYIWRTDPVTRGRVGKRPDLQTLADVECPLALIRGEHGLVEPEVLQDYLEATQGNLRIVDVVDAGHHLLLDEPLAMISAIRALTSMGFGRK